MISSATVFVVFFVLTHNLCNLFCRKQSAIPSTTISIIFFAGISLVTIYSVGISAISSITIFSVRIYAISFVTMYTTPYFAMSP